ncbi:MAG: protein TolQ, partial [Gammaproteobacteria bacterium]
MTDTSILSLMLNASIPVQLVLLILLFASIFSWALMYVKR